MMDWTKMIADLREARRYVRSYPMEAKRQALAIIERLGLIARSYEVVPDSDPGADEALRRLIQNLAVGSYFAVVAPEVLSGYLTAAAFELEAATWRIAMIQEEVESPCSP